MGAIYVFRLRFDHQFAGMLYPDGYHRFEVAPGHHRDRHRWSFHCFQRETKRGAQSTANGDARVRLIGIYPVLGALVGSLDTLAVQGGPEHATILRTKLRWAVNEGELGRPVFPRPGFRRRNPTWPAMDGDHNRLRLRCVASRCNFCSHKLGVETFRLEQWRGRSPGSTPRSSAKRKGDFAMKRIGEFDHAGFGPLGRRRSAAMSRHLTRRVWPRPPAGLRRLDARSSFYAMKSGQQAGAARRQSVGDRSPRSRWRPAGGHRMADLDASSQTPQGLGSAGSVVASGFPQA